MNWIDVFDVIISLPGRITIGVAIFAVLAAVDLYRHGRAARRWREYAFLAGVVISAMAYGAINDQVSSRISWEYFYYGKELSKVLGPDTPPDMAALHGQAALVGMKASWSVGLLIGAALLIANNPRQDRPAMAYSRLAKRVVIMIVLAVVGSTIFGTLGWLGHLTWWSADFREMAATDLWRPRHFMACWGEHLGAYLGGTLGATWMTVNVARRTTPS